MTTWDLNRLRSLRLREPFFVSSSWDEAGRSFSPGGDDCFSLFGYIPVRGIQSDDERYVNRLVLDFKEAKADAVATVAQLVAEVLREEPLWLEPHSFRGYAVAAPSSKAGIGSAGINQLLAKVAHSFPRHPSARTNNLTLSPFKLHRFKALDTPSHQQKKTVDDHLATIRVISDLFGKDATSEPAPHSADNLWSVDPTGPRVIVFDDVYTRGETFAACRQLIEQGLVDASSGYESWPSVSGFFIAKTWAKNLPSDLPSDLPF
jgi:hypothetical protein